MSEDTSFLYRCYIGICVNDDVFDFNRTVCFDKFEIIKHTKCGFWIEGYGKKRFVLNSGNRRFAFPTKEEAERNFLYRTHKQLIILKCQIQAIENEVKSKTFKNLMLKHNLKEITFK